MDADRVFHDQKRSSVDVLLINMPFGPLKKPSIGLSLLQAGLQNTLISSKIVYFTLLFAAKMGVDRYEEITDSLNASTAQVGEWIFSSSLFPNQDSNEYLETVLFADTPYLWKDEAHNSDKFLGLRENLLNLREQASHFIDECLNIVLHYHPKIVGFTSTFQQQLASLALAKRIKEHQPQTTILFGGANAEGIMGIELVRQFPFVDAVVSGEGDRVFSEMIMRLLNGRLIGDILGVYTRHNIDFIDLQGDIPNALSVQEMDRLPYPNYDDFFAQKHELSLDFPVHLLYETSRGCWWGAKSHCTFCGLNGLTMNFRSKSPERALQELLYLVERYPGHTVAAVDNILDMKYFKTFLPSLVELNLHIELFYEVKANLKKEQLRLLRQANVRMIQPGVESFSTPVLQTMRKGVRPLQNIQLLKWCEELGIEPFWNLLWGFPGEPEAEYDRTAELLPLLAHLTPPRGGGQVRLDRFSPLFVAAEQSGLVNIRPLPCYQQIYKDLSDNSLANLAYYFTFEYQDGRDVSSYTQDVLRAMTAWNEDHNQSFLYLLHDKEDIFIWDVRPIATTMLIRLTGLERDLYLACDAIQGLDTLIHIAEPYIGAISRDDMRMLLQHFVDLKLMLVEEDTYLSLAVWLDDNSPSRFQYQQALAALAMLHQLPECYQVVDSSVR